MKVLYLTPWYPSERDAMAGLFVQKHVEAVRAQGADVAVLSSWTWREMLQGWHRIKRTWGMPDIVQLNVIQKQGLLALWLKKRYGIPYVIVEHWSGYLPENGHYMRLSPAARHYMQRVCSEAETVMTVSHAQQDAMRAAGLKAKQWDMIDNVVDDFFYNTHVSYQPSETKTLLHVSCFDEQAKNVKGLLRAAKMLSEKRQDWQLVLVGTGIDYKEIRAYAESLEFPEGMLRWTGELTPREVAEEMHHADAFVLSSRYETYGVVLAEAATAGLSILSTPVGIAEEIADLIVPQEIAQNKPGRFAEFIETILWTPPHRAERTDRTRFSAESIGKKLTTIYQQTLQH